MIFKIWYQQACRIQSENTWTNLSSAKKWPFTKNSFMVQPLKTSKLKAFIASRGISILIIWIDLLSFSYFTQKTFLLSPPATKSMGFGFQAYLPLGLLTSCADTSKSWELKLTVRVLGYSSSMHPWCQRVGSLRQTWWRASQDSMRRRNVWRMYFPGSIVGASWYSATWEETPPHTNESTFRKHNGPDRFYHLSVILMIKLYLKNYNDVLWELFVVFF